MVMKRSVRLYAASLMSALLLVTPSLSARSYSGEPAPAPSAADSLVCFTIEEADSILTTLQLLQIDLDECRATAALDSAAAAARLRAEKQPWYEKVIRHPLIWFAIGAYTASQFSR